MADEIQAPAGSEQPHESLQQALEQNLGAGQAGEGASQAAPAETPAAPASLRDSASQYGVDLSHFDNDREALQYLAQQTQLAREREQISQRYLTHADKFEQFLQQQQAQAQPAQPAQPAQEKKSWWSPPEYSPFWEQLIQQDPKTGQLTGPAEIVAKYTARKQYEREWAAKLISNPTEAFKPIREELREELVAESKRLVEEALKQHTQQLQGNSFAQGYLKQNANWLLALDEKGQVQRTHTGDEVLTPAGQQWRQVNAELAQRGVADPALRAQIAQALVERQILLQKTMAASAQQQGEQGKQNLLQNGAGAVHRPAAGGSIPAPNEARSQNRSLNLEQMLRQGLEAAGHQIR